MNESYEFRAKTVDEAIADGLAALNLRREQVDVEIVNKGSRGIFGIGSEPAVVRIIPLPSTHPASVMTPSILEETPVIPAEDVTAQDDGDDWERGPVAAPGDEIVPALTATVQQDEDEDDWSEEKTKSSTADSTDIADQELVVLAHDLLDTMVRLMGIEARVDAGWKPPEPGEDEPCLMLDVSGEDLGALIGRRGETLADIQYLLRLMVNQKVRTWKNIVVDVEQYKARRADQLTQLARRMAQQVTETERALALEPMPSSDRRIIHLALREHPDVYTESSGEGDRRKVHIVPKRMRA